jgi:hypothetical protein
MWPRPVATRGAANRAECVNNLRRIGIALSQYHDDWKAFPSATSSDGTRPDALSWRVRLLPYLDHDRLFHEYDIDRPWHHPCNLSVAERMPDVYRCPGRFRRYPHGAQTSYVALFGPDAQRLVNRIRSIGAVPGPRLDAAIVVIEADPLTEHWLKPGSMLYDEACRYLSSAGWSSDVGHRINGFLFDYAASTRSVLVVTQQQGSDVLESETISLSPSSMTNGSRTPSVDTVAAENQTYDRRDCRPRMNVRNCVLFAIFLLLALLPTLCLMRNHYSPSQMT